MFWIITITIVVFAFLGDAMGVLDEKSEFREGKIFLKKPFRKVKEIDLKSVKEARLLISDQTQYGRSVIQILIGEQWETIVVNRLFNHSINKNFINLLISANPSIMIDSALEDYISAPNIGDYYINKKQILRGFLVVGILAVFVLLSFIISWLKK